MAYTHFSFTQFGERTTTKVDGALAVIDTWYQKDLPITVEKNNPDHVGEPFDQLKWKVTDGTNESNVPNLIINCPPENVLPVSENNDAVLLNETQYDLADYITLGSGVDRIKIISFLPIGELTFNGSNIFDNFVVMQYNLELLKFKTLFGVGDPYQQIAFQVGNASGFEPTVYNLSFSVDGESQLTLDNDETIVEDTFNVHQGKITVLNGVPLSQATIELTTALSAAMWSGDPANEVAVNTSSNLLIDSNGLNAFLVNLDAEGYAEIDFEVRVATADTVTGTIAFELTLMNGSADYVSATVHTATININF